MSALLAQSSTVPSTQHPSGVPQQAQQKIAPG